MVMNLKFSDFFFIENFTHFLVDQQKPPKNKQRSNTMEVVGGFHCKKCSATKDSGQKVFHPI